MNHQYSQMKPLESKNCILREVRLGDAKDMYEYYKLDIVVKYLPINRHTSISKTRKFIKAFFIDNYNMGRVGHYAIISKKDAKVIGNIGFNNIKVNAEEADIGICINPAYWGHGYATELADPIIRYGFDELNLKRIIAETYKENVNSTKPLKNLGFRYFETVSNNFSKESMGNTHLESIKSETLCYRYELLKQRYNRC
ncbi:GNAT family N-acetyltransferase [Metaclostridioides mangenotii]|uniref:RimJ/RimL family protein N-acetyltransferase n=1 Tax=Metaclostridioides mangenotii TaxID=1540 RepID=A0ABS4E846_9FIRM|nr:GNAT family N-acetyltransferase [Clostridioides mangenotii]MBP1854115.1 RimJ/RimL family protein N-acetyltransferase [Clostridioides mangenotii]